MLLSFMHRFSKRKENPLVVVILMFLTVSCHAQKGSFIDKQEVSRVINTLASDEMKGRRAFTPYADKAAVFIADEFKKAGLQTLPGNNSYLQNFAMVSSKLANLTATINGTPATSSNVVIISAQKELHITEKSGFEKVSIAKGQSFPVEARKYAAAEKNYVVIVDTSFAKSFPRLSGLANSFFKTDNSVVFILSSTDVNSFSVDATFDVTENKLANVVGVIPGKSKKDEFVIFSAHYDHIGTGTPREGVPANDADTIYNGANDDASGTTAVIELAKHFNKQKNNERTIIFVAFTAEELGGFGSQYFSHQFDPAKVMAMFNIEMIGTDSKWGKNSAYITGYEKTNMGTILQKDLQGTGFTFYPDPYPDQNLFYRSDNATLAAQGVPAHTISTSKMDSEPNYHKASDEVKTLDLDNMAKIIESIALSSASIVSGKETPTRVKE